MPIDSFLSSFQIGAVYLQILGWSSYVDIGHVAAGPPAWYVVNNKAQGQTICRARSNPYIYIILYIHTLHYITLHYTTLHYITLHYITYIYIYTYIYILIYTHIYIIAATNQSTTVSPPFPRPGAPQATCQRKSRCARFKSSSRASHRPPGRVGRCWWNHVSNSWESCIIYIYMYKCMNVWMYECMNVWMYVCMYVYVYIYHGSNGSIPTLSNI